MNIANIEELPLSIQLQVREKLGLPETAAKTSKYQNIKTLAGNQLCDSGREAIHLGELHLLVKAGEITALETQVTFHLPGGVKYICDFLYYDLKKKHFVVEDSKGFRTKEFIIKKKLMAEIGINVIEI